MRFFRDESERERKRKREEEKAATYVTEFPSCTYGRKLTRGVAVVVVFDPVARRRLVMTMLAGGFGLGRSAPKSLILDRDEEGRGATPLSTYP